MSRGIRSLLGSVMFALAGLVALTTGAFATETRVVANTYEFRVSFYREPAVAGESNGAKLVVTRLADHQPVLGLQNTLTARIAFQTQPFQQKELQAVPDQPGVYLVSFIPTRQGGYRFLFDGTVEGQPVHELFESGLKFEDVKAPKSLQFPDAVPLNSDLSLQLASAQAEAQTARLIGIGGLVVGLLGTLLAALALVRTCHPRVLARRPGGVGDEEARAAVALGPSGR